jgi:hypothetical protein
MTDTINQVREAPPLPAPDLLRKLLRYDPETGKLWWLSRGTEMFNSQSEANAWNAKYANQEAFIANNYGYRIGSIFNWKYRAHRIIWAMQTGEWPKAEIDHINGDRADNRWANLREATSSKNKTNRGSLKTSTSQYLGVCWDKGPMKWIACIKKDGKNKFLGRYTCEIEAAKAYDRAARTVHGEFARPNFPTETEARRLAAALKEQQQ